MEPVNWHRPATGVRTGMAVLLFAAGVCAEPVGRIPYLAYAAGGRSAALGGAFAALTGHAPSLFGNSAALAYADRRDVTFVTAEPAFENRLLSVQGAWPLSFGGGAARHPAKPDDIHTPAPHGKRRKDDYFFRNADRSSLFDTGRKTRRDGTRGEEVRTDPQAHGRTADADGPERARWEFFTPLREYRVTVAGSWTRSVIADIPLRDDWGYPLGTTEDARSTYALAVGAPATQDLAFGMALGWHTCDLAGDSAFGFSVDIGALYRPLFWRDTVFGATFRNVFGSMGWKVYDPILREQRDYQEPLGTEIRVGVAQRLFGAAMLTGDLVLERDLPARVAVGGEFVIGGVVALRGGWSGRDPTVGCGIRLPHVDLDYALVSNPASGMQHHLGVSAGF